MCQAPPDHCSAWSFTPTAGNDRIGFANADQSTAGGGVPTMQSWSCPGATVAAPACRTEPESRVDGHGHGRDDGHEKEAPHAGTLRQTGWPMQTIELSVDSSRERIVDLTTELERFCAGLGDGLVNVFVPHATAGVALMETGLGIRGRPARRAGPAPPSRRLLPPRARIAGPRGRSRPARLREPVGDAARVRGPGGPGDLAVRGAGGPERRQPPSTRALQLRARLRWLTGPSSRAIARCQSGSTSGTSALCAGVARHDVEHAAAAAPQ